MLRWTLIALVLALAGAAVLVYLALARWDAEIEREIAAIEASGAPLDPRDLTLAPSAGPAWWASIPSWSDPTDDAGLWNPETLDALLQRPDEELEPYGRELLEQLEALYDAPIEGDPLLADYNMFAMMLRVPPPPNDGPPSRTTVIVARLLDAASGELLYAAEGACSGPDHDAKAWIDGWLASDEPLPQPVRVIVPMCLQHALGRRAWLAALDGDEDAARRSLRLGFCAARGFESTPGASATLIRFLQTTLATRALMGVAGLLPGADLSEFDEELARIDARARAVRALEEERAIGYAVFQQGLDLDGDAVGGWTSPLRTLALRLFERNDTRVYLRTYAALIDAAQRPIGEASDAFDQAMAGLADETFALRSQLIVPSASNLLRAATEVEAQTTLARAVLLARREGVPAARDWIVARVDPYADAPYRATIDSEGGLRVWSVGPDGVDDGGASDGPSELDLVAVSRSQR